MPSLNVDPPSMVSIPVDQGLCDARPRADRRLGSVLGATIRTDRGRRRGST
ncbi:unnamed protein product [Trichogramma brassicae]|uniref:Uncharacterized protein n=1 Tax=Trichogramma brassicae TaxID=86971 RepID=A0A6H5IP92_9HYME|nr:unnamed protein product [Trichogramma brassicae]